MERRDPVPEDKAPVIDLVHLPPGTRPTPFALLDYEEVTRCRVLDCASYGECLSFAARLQWPSFHCRQCPKYALAVKPEHGSTRARASGPDAAVIKLR